MNRIVKIVGYAVMLFVLYIGSTALLKSCKSANTGETIVEDDSSEEYGSDDEIYDEYFESDEDASEAGIEVQDVGSSTVDPEYKTTEKDAVEDYDDDFSFEADEDEKKQINKPTSQPAKVQKAVKTVNQPSASAGGSFLVVAGSYLIKDNAEKMVSKLKNIGYNGAEIVNFDLSQYHSISAGRYNTYEQAEKVVQVLKNKGIDCYVHTRK